jgi:rod shape-determining protein MreB
MDSGIVYVGMDLGTFKTAVTSSGGGREVLYSAVGWPKDHVAQAMLGRNLVFGKEIIEHRLALDVVRPFEKGVLKYHLPEDAGVPEEKVARHKEAAKLLIEHAVALVVPRKGVGVCGVIGAPSRASVTSKRILLEAARSSFDAVLIVPEPFAIAYGSNRLSDTLVIDIGAGTIDICLVYGIFPGEQDQVTVPLGGDVIDERFLKGVRELYPNAQVSINMAREIKEKYGFVHDSDEKVMVTLPVNGKPNQFDVTEPLRDACRTVVAPLVEGLCDVIARCDPELQHRMLGNILLAGGGGQLKGLDRVIKDALREYGNVKVGRAYDAVFAGAAGALKLAMEMPAENWNKVTSADRSRAAA